MKLMRERICGGVCFLFPLVEMTVLTVVIDMVAAEERKIAARKSAAKEHKSSEKKASAPADK
jgi:hypothetical protein